MLHFYGTKYLPLPSKEGFRKMQEEMIKTSCTVAHQHCKCFEKLTDEQKQLVEENQVTIEYKKGEVIAKQGAFTTHVIFICEGLGKVFYENNKSKLILRIAAPGSLIGLTSLGKYNNIFQYTASAYIPTMARLIDIKLFRQLIEENGLFAAAIVDILSEIAVQKNQRFFCLTHRQSYGKLADLLLCLAGNIFKDSQFDLPITRKELAELAGMSPESVIRTMRMFQDDGLIQTNGKNIEILDNEGLLKICELG
jgi:CRP-like cAMP-binding protein